MTYDPQATLDTGAVFGERYRIVRCIRTGGMGGVYEAVHGETGRRVALKVMLPSLVTDVGLRARFKLEATVAASVESEHIVDVFDAGIDVGTGAPFLVMELLRGDDLSAVLKRQGAFSAEDVVHLLWQAALALDKTHALGIVHRDLKPENLFYTVRDDGTPRLKILDFGIAKVMAHNPSGGQQTATVGTPLYMAPEQISGDPIEQGCDLYSLGHIAYSLLVGRSYWSDEWQGGPIYSLLLKVLKGASELASVRAARAARALPSGFDPWFARATALSPKQRFRSASEMIEALAEALGVGAPTQRRQRKTADAASESEAHLGGALGEANAVTSAASVSAELPDASSVAPPAATSSGGSPAHPRQATPAPSAPSFPGHTSQPSMPSLPRISGAAFALGITGAAPTPPSGVNFSVTAPVSSQGDLAGAGGPEASGPAPMLRQLLLAAVAIAAVAIAGVLFLALWGAAPVSPLTSSRGSATGERAAGEPVDPVAALPVAEANSVDSPVNGSLPEPGASGSSAPSGTPSSTSAPVKGPLKPYRTPDPVGTSFY